MRIISNADYKELQALRAHHKRELMWESAHSTSLEDDIDAPLRACVMALALLGCEPKWSCCGFDYPGQPIHKWHEYGRVFINVADNPVSGRFVRGFLLSGLAGSWEIGSYERCIGPDAPVERLVAMKADFQARVIPQWDDKDCPHYPESAMLAIATLENHLLTFTDEFADEVLLHDTNLNYREHFRYWQYPTKPDWVIRKSDLLNRVQLSRQLNEPAARALTLVERTDDLQRIAVE